MHEWEKRICCYCMRSDISVAHHHHISVLSSTRRYVFIRIEWGGVNLLILCKRFTEGWIIICRRYEIFITCSHAITNCEKYKTIIVVGKQDDADAVCMFIYLCILLIPVGMILRRGLFLKWEEGNLSWDTYGWINLSAKASERQSHFDGRPKKQQQRRQRQKAQNERDAAKRRDTRKWEAYQIKG